MALLGLKQLDSPLTGSLKVSGSSQITGSLYVSSSMLANDAEITDTLTAGGHLYISDSIVHSADTNTKIRFPEADTISFHTSGDERMRISTGGHITASGDVSSSATSTGSFGRVEAVGVVYADSFQSVTGGNTIDFNDDVSLIGNLTASAHISASGNITGSDIYSSGRIYEQGSSVIDHATAMAIVFGG